MRLRHEVRKRVTEVWRLVTHGVTRALLHVRMRCVPRTRGTQRAILRNTERP